MNIPIYRAKRSDSDEWVEGELIKKLSWCYIATITNVKEKEII